MDDITATIKNYIQDEFVRDDSKQLTEDLPLIQSGVVDSLGVFTLISFVEERFNIRIEPDDIVLDNFKTIRALADLTKQRQALATS